MYAPAQAMQQALNRRLQRQQMEQSADIADQNNAMQLLSQGQEAAQNDMSREAALERLKEQAASAVLRGQISADARVKQAETAADWHKDAAGKLLAGKMYGTDGSVTSSLARDESNEKIAGMKVAGNNAAAATRAGATVASARARANAPPKGKASGGGPQLSAQQKATIDAMRMLKKSITDAEGGNPMAAMMIQNQNPGQIAKWRSEWIQLAKTLPGDTEVPDDAVIQTR